MSHTSTEDTLRSVIGETLGLGNRAAGIRRETPLLGHMPELDSMAVADLVLAIEDAFAITIEDDEIDADTFQTFGSLADFVAGKRR